jgi:hypothetical protein
MIMGGLLNAVSTQFLTIGMLAKAYAHLSGLRHDPMVVWCYRVLKFEKLMLIAGPIIAIGLLLVIQVVAKWVASGFGPLNEARLLFFGMLCVINGTQIAAAGYLFSIMALPRHFGSFHREHQARQEME